MMTDTDLLTRLLQSLEWWRPQAAALDAYAEGRQPLAWLAPEARDALGGRMPKLAVNLPRLTVSAVAERLSVTGFRVDGPDSQPDPDLWRVWLRNRMMTASAAAHQEALTLGRAPVIVWAGDNPDTPLITAESPRQVWVARDPETGVATAAAKAWVDPWAGQSFAVLYEPDRVTHYTQRAAQVPLPQERADTLPVPLDGWTLLDTIDNPLGVVPVVELVNSARLLDFWGRSEMADVLDAADAINKTLADAMVTSESYARPRRWVTGLEPVLDDDGNPINPFAAEMDRLWHAESPDTNFGEFAQASMSGYTDLVKLWLQMVGAVGNLPEHFLGAGGGRANPTSADAIRAAEAPLVARALDRQRVFGASWDDVARLVVAVRDGVDPAGVTVETVWASPETRTPAQAADAAAKLAGIGMPLESVLADPLGYSPAHIAAVMDAKRSEALLNAGTNLAALTK